MATTCEALSPLVTRRMVIGHVVMCRGCCCGDTVKGKPEIPVEWLKHEWKQRGLLKHIQLTISGCLGPCDLCNVVTIADSAVRIWLGGLCEHRHYMALLEWALESKASGRLLPLPCGLDHLRFNPFRPTEQSALVHRGSGERV